MARKNNNEIPSSGSLLARCNYFSEDTGPRKAANQPESPMGKIQEARGLIMGGIKVLAELEGEEGTFWTNFLKRSDQRTKDVYTMAELLVVESLVDDSKLQDLHCEMTEQEGKHKVAGGDLYGDEPLGLNYMEVNLSHLIRSSIRRARSTIGNTTADKKAYDRSAMAAILAVWNKVAPKHPVRYDRATRRLEAQIRVIRPSMDTEIIRLTIDNPAKKECSTIYTIYYGDNQRIELNLGTEEDERRDFLLSAILAKIVPLLICRKREVR